MLAIECKNLSCALLVSRMPREMEEAFHEILVFTWSATATSARRILRDGDNHSHYIRGEMVGKSVVRFPPKGSDQSNDVYDGWSQAVQSAASFLWEESPKIRADQGQQRGAAVVPFLIVADGSLWVVDYDKTGARIGPSMMVDHCEVFIGKQICSNRPVEYGHQWNYTMSHLEIFTKTGFQKFMNTDLSEWANRLVMPVIQGRV